MSATRPRAQPQRCIDELSSSRLVGRRLSSTQELRKASVAAHPPVMRLSNEALCRIFYFVKAPCPSDWNDADSTDEELPWKRHPLCWITVSHVCRAWRKAALNALSLWIDIPVFNPKWASIMLSRSRGAARIVTANYSPANRHRAKLETTKAALRKLPNIQEINLYGFNGLELTDILPPVAPRPTSHLHTLRIACPRSSNSKRSPLSTYILSDENIQAMKLKRLALVRCSLNWRGRFLRTITHLRICDIPEKSRPPLKEVVAALQNMPMLVSLDLQQAIAHRDTPHTYQQVRLPHLELLRIAALSVEIVGLLDSMNIRHSVVLRLSCDDADRKGLKTVMKSLKKYLLARYAVGNKPSSWVRSLMFTCNIDGDLVFRASPNETAPENIVDELEDVEFPDPPRIQASFDEPDMDIFAPRRIAWRLLRLLRVLPLDHLTDLRITHFYVQFDKTQWEIVGELPRLRSILIRNGLDGFFSTLCAKKMPTVDFVYRGLFPRDRDTPFIHYFPSLKDITIYEGLFNEQSDGQETQNHMLDCLMMRCELGSPIERMAFIESSRLPDEDIDRFREVVPDVVWDGVAKGFECYQGEYSQHEDSEESSDEDKGDDICDSDIDSMDVLTGVWH